MENIESVDTENTTPEIDEKLIGDIVEKRLNEIANKNKKETRTPLSNDSDNVLENGSEKIRNIRKYAEVTLPTTSFYTVNKTATVASGSGGGYVANPAYGDQVITQAKQYGLARQLCDVKPVFGKSVTWPKISTGTTVYEMAELGSTSAVDIVWSQVTITPKKAAAFSGLSNELIQDQSYPIVEELVKDIGKDFARFEDTKVFTGTGTWTGITNTANIGTVSASVSGSITASTVQATVGLDLRDLVTTVESQNINFVKNGAFFMHPTLKAIVAKTLATTNQFIFGSGNDGFPDRLYGYPVYTTNALPGTSTTTIGTQYVVFGDMSTIIFGDRMAIDVMEIKEGTVGSLSMAQNDSTGYRFIERFDFALTQPGAFATYRTRT